MCECCSDCFMVMKTALAFSCFCRDGKGFWLSAAHFVSLPNNAPSPFVSLFYFGVSFCCLHSWYVSVMTQPYAAPWNFVIVHRLNLFLVVVCQEWLLTTAKKTPGTANNSKKDSRHPPPTQRMSCVLLRYAVHHVFVVLVTSWVKLNKEKGFVKYNQPSQILLSL